MGDIARAATIMARGLTHKEIYNWWAREPDRIVMFRPIDKEHILLYYDTLSNELIGWISANGSNEDKELLRKYGVIE